MRELTDTEKAFVYASNVLRGLAEKGITQAYFQIFYDGSCTLYVPLGQLTHEVTEQAMTALRSRRVGLENGCWWTLTSCGLVAGGLSYWGEEL